VYDTVRGNRRKAFRPGTFDLGRAPFTATGGRVLRRGATTLKVTVAQPSAFCLKVGPCGFDDWPDLHVRVAGKYGPDEEVD
jgi:hypothetical protein